MSATIVSQMPRNTCHSQATTHICFLSSSSVLWHIVKDKGRGQVHQALLARLCSLGGLRAELSAAWAALTLN